MDKLAKKGLGLITSEEFQGYTSLSHLRRLSKSQVQEEWKSKWYKDQEDSDKGLVVRGMGTHYRQVAQDLLPFKSQPSFAGKYRRQQSAYIQLKTGIGYLKPFLKIINALEDDECAVCGAKETTAHLLLSCSRYRAERQVMRKKIEGRCPLSLQMLFGTAVGKEILMGFLLTTGICTREWAEPSQT